MAQKTEIFGKRYILLSFFFSLRKRITGKTLFSRFTFRIFDVGGVL